MKNTLSVLNKIRRICENSSRRDLNQTVGWLAEIPRQGERTGIQYIYPVMILIIGNMRMSEKRNFGADFAGITDKRVHTVFDTMSMPVREKDSCPLQCHQTFRRFFTSVIAVALHKKELLFRKKLRPWLSDKTSIFMNIVNSFPDHVTIALLHE